MIRDRASLEIGAPQGAALPRAALPRAATPRASLRPASVPFAGVPFGAVPLAALACAALTPACLGAGPEAPVSELHAVSVEPRVVIDGIVELGQRSGGRVVVDEVLFHAPGVMQRGEAGATDVLATDGDNGGPLLFRYDIGSADGFGDVLGGARQWVLQGGDEGSALEFGFSPFALESSARARLEDAAGVYLGDLVDHTAYVHGYVAMSAQGAGFGTECDGDPDGNPADCGRDDGERADGDPDGNPAGPTPKTDGDPDGNPARPRSSEELRADEDDSAGSDANADDAGAADGDPDGNPAKPGHRGFAEDELAVQGNPFDDDALVTRVPFLLVLNASFALQVPVQQLLSVEVNEAAGEVLPIDLHLSLDELFSTSQLGALEEQAATQPAGGVVLEGNASGAVGIDVRTSGVRRAADSATNGGIRVVGDLR